NVFPVPDGDTGTNFALTARSIADRLLASGRVGRGRALLGTLLDIKPILGLDSDGRVAPLARVRGRRQLLPRVMELLAERVPPGAKVRFGVVHVACEEVLDEVASALRERYGEEAEILTGPASPVLATHIGPGGWGWRTWSRTADARRSCRPRGRRRRGRCARLRQPTGPRSPPSSRCPRGT